ncbi:hypothetical protein Bca101_015127 [Brassica carinata]
MVKISVQRRGATVASKKKSSLKKETQKRSTICSLNKEKEMEIVEITADLWETMKKTKTKIRKKLTNEEIAKEEGTPLRGVFCLKTRQDMKAFEEKEDCFILDFDPNDSFDSEKQSFSENPEGGDDDVAIIHEKGQCYCYVCDVAAPCAQWTPNYEPHCEALENSRWKSLRELHRGMRP